MATRPSVDLNAAKAMLRTMIESGGYTAAAQLAQSDETGVLSDFVIGLLRPAAEAFKIIDEWEQKRKK
jgi:hypothetical protein